MNDRPAVLVTGGAGYIGSHCCRALDAAGYHPVVYDNFSTGHRSFITGSLISGDLRDGARLARAFARHDIVAVMHFAASSLVGESVLDPGKYYANNVGVIKTSGGLFNFLSGSRPRAPLWMQHVGHEWAWRIWLEPRRLFWRYLTTIPRALYLLLNKSKPQVTDRRERD